MRFKQFYSNHKPLFRTILGVLITLLLWAVLVSIHFLTQPAEALFEPEPPEIKMADAIVVVTEIPEVTPVPTPSPEPTPAPRYGFTNDDIYLMTVLLCGSKKVDGDGEFDFDFGRKDEYDQISLVLCVVMNRVRSDLFPDTVSGVIWQKGQFSGMYRWKNKLPQVSDVSLQRVTDWCKAYDAYDAGAQSIPEEHLYFCGNGKVNRSR